MTSLSRHQSRVWIDYVGDTNTRLAFVTNKSKKRKSTSPSAIHVENRKETLIAEEKLDVICPLEKGERIVDICRNVRFTHNILRKIRDNAGRIKESPESKSKCLCSKTITALTE